MDRMIEEVGKKLINQGKTIASAESCTGGLFSAALTDVPGISAVFCEGYVTYADHVKEKNLGVSRQTLLSHGAVSHACAGEMAEGVRARAGSDIGVAATGIAGPGGGTPEKPVGTVYIAVADETGTRVEKLSLTGDRRAIREQTVERLFALISEIL